MAKFFHAKKIYQEKIQVNIKKNTMLMTTRIIDIENIAEHLLSLGGSLYLITQLHWVGCHGR